MSTSRELMGYMVSVLRQCLFSSHPRYCGSISNSDLFKVIIMVARCVRGYAGEWAGNSHV
jgi:hypothetical protein